VNNVSLESSVALGVSSARHTKPASASQAA
jgi:hypothetical protein